jgi:hypothetical protein
MNGVIFEFHIGNTYSRNFIIKKYDEDIDKMYFSIKKSDDDEKTILQKTLDDGITIVDAEYDDDNNVISRTYNLLLNADDTEGFKVGIEYPFDIKIVTNKDADDIKLTIMNGTLTLTTVTTRKWNEVA